jgi:hypothetical protein
MEVIKNLKVSILNYIESSSYPAWVRCSFSDVNGNVHYITEKLPVITELDINEESDYPIIGNVRCQVVSAVDEIVKIDTSNPFSIEDENGESIFEVFANQVE